MKCVRALSIILHEIVFISGLALAMLFPMYCLLVFPLLMYTTLMLGFYWNERKLAKANLLAAVMFSFLIIPLSYWHIYFQHDSPENAFKISIATCILINLYTFFFFRSSRWNQAPYHEIV